MTTPPKRKRGRPRNEFRIAGDVSVAEAHGGELAGNADAFMEALERVLRRQIHREAATQGAAPTHSTTIDKKAEAA